MSLTAVWSVVVSVTLICEVFNWFNSNYHFLT